MPTLPQLPNENAATDRGRVPSWLQPSTAVELLKGPPPNEMAAQTLFSEARQQFEVAAKSQGEGRKEAFSEAAEVYAEAAERGEGFPVSEDALMMKAESYFFADDYPKATEAYGELVKAFPNTEYLDKVDKRRFAIAQYWLDLKKEATLIPNFSNEMLPTFDAFGSAVKLYDRIRFDNPTGTLSDDATMAAAVAQFEQADYADADELFTDLRQNFPSSQHQFQAHLLGLKCKLMSYEGPEYDGGSLNEAEDLIKQIGTLFPEDARDHYDMLDQAYKDIRLKKAERLFKLAQYYDRRKEYRAARMHYETVRQDFSDTNLAVEAESRLAQIKGEPDKPPQNMKWLSDMFPEEDTRPRPLIQRNPTGK